jgi:hypothetical protein
LVERSSFHNPFFAARADRAACAKLARTLAKSVS